MNHIIATSNVISTHIGEGLSGQKLKCGGNGALDVQNQGDQGQAHGTDRRGDLRARGHESKHVTTLQDAVII